jgi:hypothetical protein
MPAADTVARLTAFAGRGAGSNAERQAAQWLASELSRGRREAHTETFWCRPNWALAHTWHCLVAVTGSLLMVSHARLGGGVVLVALLCVLADCLTGRSPGRWLTPERASQNVVSPAVARRSGSPSAGAVRLIVTANIDAGRTGLAYRRGLRAPLARVRRLAGDGRFTPGWLGWLCLELVWLLIVAGLRSRGASGLAVGIAQLVPTALLVIELALLLELGISPFGPGAGDNASGVAVAMALVRALDASPPRRLEVELVLQGAGDSAMLGLRRHLARRRRELRAATTAVVGVGPCGSGSPCWWESDGSFLPLRFHRRLIGLARRLAAPDAMHPARPQWGRGTSPALPARARGLPAITIGAVDEFSLAPRSHEPRDVAGAVQGATLDEVLEFALTLVDALDAELSQAVAEPPVTAASSPPAGT